MNFFNIENNIYIQFIMIVFNNKGTDSNISGNLWKKFN